MTFRPPKIHSILHTTGRRDYSSCNYCTMICSLRSRSIKVSSWASCTTADLVCCANVYGRFMPNPPGHRRGSGGHRQLSATTTPTLSWRGGRWKTGRRGISLHPPLLGRGGGSPWLLALFIRLNRRSGVVGHVAWCVWSWWKVGSFNTYARWWWLTTNASQPARPSHIYCNIFT